VFEKILKPIEGRESHCGVYPSIRGIVSSGKRIWVQSVCAELYKMKKVDAARYEEGQG
jgi:hypothetical protein